MWARYGQVKVLSSVYAGRLSAGNSCSLLRDWTNMRLIDSTADSDINAPKEPAFNGLPCEPVFGPLIHGHGAQLPVELDRWLVPIEDSPLQPAAAAFGRNSCNLL